MFAAKVVLVIKQELVLKETVRHFKSVSRMLTVYIKIDLTILISCYIRIRQIQITDKSN